MTFREIVCLAMPPKHHTVPYWAEGDDEFSSEWRCRRCKTVIRPSMCSSVTHCPREGVDNVLYQQEDGRQDQWWGRYE